MHPDQAPDAAVLDIIVAADRDGTYGRIAQALSKACDHQALAVNLIRVVLEKHEKAVLQFSGGKDSLACLYLLRPWWERVTVLWMNAGAALPETVEQMSRIRELVPHFVEAESNQPEQIELMGMPADVVPVRNTAVGQMFQPNDGVLLQPSWECCAANVWLPMQEAVRKLGATLVIRGQRAEERRKAPIKSGHQEHDVTFLFPIEGWSAAMVLEYLAAQGVDLPAHYEYTATSLDCWSCTAYLDENIGRMKYLREKHPHLWPGYKARLQLVKDAVLAELQNVDDAMSEEPHSRGAGGVIAKGGIERETKTT